MVSLILGYGDLVQLREAWRWLDMVLSGELEARGAAQAPPAASEVEVGILLAAPDLNTYIGHRDHVIMATL